MGLYCVLALGFTTTALRAQNEEHRLSIGLGGLNPQSGTQSETLKSAPLMSFDYGYQFFRHGRADVGVDVGFASDKGTDRRRNIYLPRFGYSFLIPLWNDRIEAALGAGAAHSFIKSPIPGYESWLVYGQLGAAYAVDVNRKYRAGFFLRWYRDPIGRPEQQFISVGGQFTYAFGGR